MMARSVGSSSNKKTPVDDKTRRMPTWLALTVVIAMVISACGSDTPSEGSETDGTGTGGTQATGSGGDYVEDVLEVTLAAEPPTLDWHNTTAGATQQAAINIFETLYAVDAEYAPVPMLAADDPEVSNDGLTHTIELRQDVLFHNGATMTADDVVASLERWGKVSPIGQSFFGYVDEVVAVNENSIEIRLTEPNNDVARILAVPVAAAAIMPASILGEVGDSLIEEDDQVVGTGPFQLSEWVRGSHYELARFDDYTPDSRDRSGLAGTKEPTLSGVRVTFNPDASSRLSGVETGQFDFALELPGDSYDRVNESDELQATIVSPFYSAFALLDTANPPFDDPRVRKAAQLAVNPEQTMASMIGHPEMYELSGGIYPQGMGILYSEAGTEDYLTHDPEQAANLLEEAGYDGEEVVYMTTQEIDFLYDAAVVISQNMTDAGFNVRLDVSEWAEVVSRIGEPDTWDVFGTAFGVGYITPTSHLHFSGYSPYEGWYASEGTEARSILDEWPLAEDDKQREDIMARLQAQFYEDLPAIKLGDYKLMNVTTTSVVTESHEFYWPTFWTIHLTE